MALHADLEQIEWQTALDGVQWAHACDFPKNAFTSAQRANEQECGAVCAATNACTHFSWTNYKEGTCWLKNGHVARQHAKFNDNYEMICGLIPSNH